MAQKLLVIGSVWPEPKSSAAGSRMLQLLHVFLSEGYQITFASATADSPKRFPIEDLGIAVANIKMNDASFDNFVTDLRPTIVLFDRFMTEEQFGWRVEKHSPTAIRLLDTEDLHCLRKARERAVKQEKSFENSDLISDISKREIASIFRCDLSLMISTYEMELLQDFFKVPATQLLYVPFLVDTKNVAESDCLPSFEERIDFVTIGSFLHAPNWDSVLYLKKHIWPELRKKVPNASMQVYGSYPPQKAMQLHKPSEKFYVNGWAEDAAAVVKNARVVLAPLRFGAGLKGKFMDAMANGTPSVTTSIGAEAMHGTLPWGGFVMDNATEIIEAATTLYTDMSTWKTAQQNGFEILKRCYNAKEYARRLLETIADIAKDINSHRSNHFVGQMLLYHNLRSTEFMARWIEAKNS